MPEDAASSSASLSATYVSPSGSRNFERMISLPQIERNGSIGAQAKTKYLSELRSSSKRLQEDINKFLTQMMEKDKTVPGQTSEKQKTKDELEEEHYGEEAAEDDT